MAAAGHRSNVEWLGCRRVEGLLRDRGALFGETGNAALIRPGAENQPERPASIYLPCAWNKSPRCVCVCVWCAHSKQTRTKGFIHAFESAPLQVQSCFSAALVKGKTFYLSASNGPFIKVLFHSNQSHN